MVQTAPKGKTFHLSAACLTALMIISTISSWITQRTIGTLLRRDQDTSKNSMRSMNSERQNLSKEVGDDVVGAACGWLAWGKKRQTDLVTMKDPYRQLWSFPLRTCFWPSGDDVASRSSARSPQTQQHNALTTTVLVTQSNHASFYHLLCCGSGRPDFCVLLICICSFARYVRLVSSARRRGYKR